MKVELKELGPNNDPYLILTAQCLIDAVRVGELVEKCATRNLSYSSNTAVLSEGDMPYISVKLTAISAALTAADIELPEKFKAEKEKTDGKTTGQS